MEIMTKVKFTYSEPGIGEIEYDGVLDKGELINFIEETFPTYTDIEITTIEDI